MTLDEYNEKVSIVQEALKLPKGEIVDCEFYLEREEFIEVFNFYDEALLHHSYYGITPAYVYINNRTTINAFACLKKDGNYFVSLNQGLVLLLIQSFKNNRDIVERSNIRLFEILEPRLDTQINNLMYQTLLHYTFYHELAHLIQNSDLLVSEVGLEENPRQDGFSEQQHVIELDADEFSSLCLGTHILQYSEKIFGEDINKEVLEGLLVLMCIPIILYWTSFSGFEKGLYFERNTHPHPIIRIFIIVSTIVHYCNQSLVQEERKFQLDHKEIIFQSLDITAEMEANVFGRDNVIDFIIRAKENTKEIIDYIDKFEGLRKKNTSLAVNKWNEQVDKRNQG